ncbi:conserved hypothetical protein [Tenacibaculum litopenaei]
MIKFLIHSSIILVLTIITQIGGILYLLSILLFYKYTRRIKLMVFTSLYLLATFFIVPKIAPLFGRVKIANTPYLTQHSLFTVLCNRNYVRPTLHKVLQKTGKQLQTYYPGVKISYLDACFPFFDGFPLLPHLSHKDGKKIDLNFMYLLPSGQPTSQGPSVSGYGVFQAPKPGEQNKPAYCHQKGYWQYSFTKYLTFGSTDELRYSSKHTKKLVQLLLRQSAVKKIFLEPHLIQRMGIQHSKLRFHGCKAVRHDDHLHVQL